MKSNKSLIILALIIIPLMIVNYYYMLNKYYIPILKNKTEISGDIIIYLDAAEAFKESSDKLYTTSKNEVIGPSWYLYPPPSIMLFYPLTIFSKNTAYIVFSIIITLSYVLSFFLLIKSFSSYFSINNSLKPILFFLYIALGPFVYNIRYGQVMTIILLIISITLYLFVNNKIFLATFILTIGFWIKVYPIILLPFLIMQSPKKAILGFLSGLIIIPLILLPFIPLKLYSYFFFDILPNISTMVTVSSFNKSLISSILILNYSIEELTSWPGIVVPTYAKLINFIAGFITYTFFLILFIFKKHNYKIFSIIIITALLPVFSNYGWEYSFITVSPLILVSLYRFNTFKKNQQLIILFVLPFFIIPKPPDTLLLKVSDFIPEIFIYLFFYRYLFGIIILSILNLSNKKQLDFIDSK